MEYYCRMCHEWFNVDYCRSHYEGTHGSSNMTFEALQKRMSVVGGLLTRDDATEVEQRKDERPFVTNNFRHYL